MINISFAIDNNLIINELLTNKNIAKSIDYKPLIEYIMFIYNKYHNQVEANKIITKCPNFKALLLQVSIYQKYLTKLIKNTPYYQLYLINDILKLNNFNCFLIGELLPTSSNTAYYLGNKHFKIGKSEENIIAIYHEAMHSILEYNDIKRLKETKDKLLLNPNDINLICLKELIMDINHAIIELCIEYQLGSLLGNYLSITNGHDETIIYKQMLINDWEKYLKDANSNIYQFRDTAIDKILTKHR
ncbi:MAG: hypothetical protein RR161_02820 [Bacilli bacterium]